MKKKLEFDVELRSKIVISYNPKEWNMTEKQIEKVIIRSLRKSVKEGMGFLYCGVEIGDIAIKDKTVLINGS